MFKIRIIAISVALCFICLLAYAAILLVRDGKASWASKSQTGFCIILSAAGVFFSAKVFPGRTPRSSRRFFGRGNWTWKGD